MQFETCILSASLPAADILLAKGVESSSLVAAREAREARGEVGR